MSACHICGGKGWIVRIVRMADSDGPEELWTPCRHIGDGREPEADAVAASLDRRNASKTDSLSLTSVALANVGKWQTSEQIEAAKREAAQGENGVSSASP